MESENILAVNVPNAVSIVIMAVVGMALLAFAKKSYDAAVNKQAGG